MKNKTLVIIIAALVLLIGIILVYLLRGRIAQKGEQNSEQSVLCGGIMGRACPEGYWCQMEGDYPDASGKCIKSNGV